MNVTTDTLVCQMSQKIFESKHCLFAVSLILSVMAASTVAGNGTVFVAMIQTLRKHGDLQAFNNHNNSSCITKLLMLSMTVAGVFVGTFIMPLSLVEVISNGDWTLGIFMYKLRVLLDYLLCSITSLHITFMAADTYLVVCKPLLYRLLTPRTGYIMTAVCWILPILIMTSWLIVQPNSFSTCKDFTDDCSFAKNTKVLDLVSGSFFWVLFLSVWVLYLIVLRQVRQFRLRNFHSNNKTIRYLSNSTIAVCYTVDGKETNSEQVIIQNNSFSKQKVNSTNKGFCFIGAVLLCFSICWAPNWIILLATTSCQVTIPEWVYILLDWLTYFSSTVNPVIYCNNTSIRLAVKSLIGLVLFKRK